MVYAYDAIRAAIDGDAELIAFLSAQSRKHGLANGKSSGADIRRNIEERIFRDALKVGVICF